VIAETDLFAKKTNKVLQAARVARLELDLGKSWSSVESLHLQTHTWRVGL